MGKKTDCFRYIFLSAFNGSGGFLGAFNTLLILSSVAIITLVLVPIKFKSEELRYNSNGQAPPSDSLALAMTVVQYRNYFSNVPDVHLNVSQDQMTDFWFLPQGTRLSPLMQSIARCRMAADVNSVDDPEVCNRVPVGHSFLFSMIVAIINLVDIVWGGYTKRVVKNDDAKTLHAFFHVITWNVLFVVLVFIVYLQTDQFDMVYTLPGEVYPKPFYAIPAIWLLAFFLCLPIFNVKLLECFVFCDVIASAK